MQLSSMEHVAGWALLGLAVGAHVGFPAYLGARASVRHLVERWRRLGSVGPPDRMPPSPSPSPPSSPSPPTVDAPADPLAWPRVSVLIAAHNEAACIVDKIRNTLALDYPPDRLEVWIGSDGSTDGTAELARSFEPHGVRVVENPRGGKSAMLNALAARATGEVFVLSDANTWLDPKAVRHLVRSLSLGTPAPTDRSLPVGAACGRILLTDPQGRPCPESSYWRLETWVKSIESDDGALIGLNGALYAVRAGAFQPLPAGTLIDDLVEGLLILRAGWGVVLAPDAWGSEPAPSEGRTEWHRRVRIAAGVVQSRPVWAPMLRRRDAVGRSLLWHKVLRWAAPWTALGSMSLAVARMAQGHLGWLELTWSVLLGMMLTPGGTGRLLRHAALLHAAIGFGTLRSLWKPMPAMWTPTVRAPTGEVSAPGGVSTDPTHEQGPPNRDTTGRLAASSGPRQQR